MIICLYILGLEPEPRPRNGAKSLTAGVIIMSISLDDWAWSRLKLIKGFPVIKTHDWGRFGDLIWICVDLH